jgi:TonB family protein
MKIAPRSLLYTLTLFLMTTAGLPAQSPEKAGPIDPDLFGSAVLRTAHRPQYPASALKDKVVGVVKVRFIVDAAGKVTQARVLEPLDPRLDAAAIDAVKSWTFAPAIEKGREVATCLDVTLAFDLGSARSKGSENAQPLSEREMPQPVSRTQAQPTVTPSGHYPEVLTKRKIPGAALFSCVVNPQGRATDIKITSASHADFVLPAMAALAEWEFTPGMEGDLAIVSEIDGEMTFSSIGNLPADVLAANGITTLDGTVPAISPSVRYIADPVWPVDLLLKGESGSASVEFTISENGLVTDVEVREATAPAFGKALAAAVATWVFDRAFDHGQVVSQRLLKHADFELPVGGDSADPVVRIVSALQSGTPMGAKGLDSPLKPIYRVSPLYPNKLAKPNGANGQAMIEFVVDQEGRARLPRIVSASDEAFGWAAATAIGQSVFTPPRRGGKPVDVKVRIPISFAPPAT